MITKNHTPPPILCKGKCLRTRLNTRGAITLQTVIITAVLALGTAGVGIIVYNTTGEKTENLASTNSLVEKFTATEKAIVDARVAGTNIEDPAVPPSSDSTGPDNDPDLTDEIRAIRYKQISGLIIHSCAIRGTNKEVWCWGSNANNKLGNTGSIDGSPVKVPNLSNILSVAVGGQFSCALLNNGAVKCWGRNNAGQLGNSLPSTTSINPLTVDGIEGTTTANSENPKQIAISIAAGGDHACAILQDETAKCWGFNNFGQLGNAQASRISLPTQVWDSANGEALGNIVSIAAGSIHTCAAISDGTVRCWGFNDEGQLGNGTTDNSFIPVPATGLGPPGNNLAVSVSAGQFHTCATLRDGKARCWGRNTGRQIGTISNIATPNRNNNNTRETTPTRVYEDFVLPNSNELTSVNSISPGENHTCSIRTINQISQVSCWGDNSHGQLGIGTARDSNARYTNEESSTRKIAATVLYNDNTNIEVIPLDNIKGVSSGKEHSCAVRGDDDEVWCWGSNTDSQLGLGTTQTQYTLATQLTF